MGGPVDRTVYPVWPTRGAPIAANLSFREVVGAKKH